jgi:hypothetical protein
MYTVEFYSAIKKNEIMSFGGKWMELEIISPTNTSITRFLLFADAKGKETK